MEFPQIRNRFVTILRQIWCNKSVMCMDARMGTHERPRAVRGLMSMRVHLFIESPTLEHLPGGLGVGLGLGLAKSHVYSPFGQRH